MPVGLLVMRWDERVGTQITAKYPEELNMTEGTLMQIYSTHEYSGEAGMISLMVGSLNIASYYTGPQKQMYIILLLSLDDDPDAFESGLADIARIILQNTSDDGYISMIPSLYRRLSVYPSLSQEQLLAITYQDEIKRMIINRLRDEGVVTKSELSVWLKDTYTYGFIDIDAILFELIKRDIIKEASVKGMPSELIFLISDLLISRKPPDELLKDPAKKGLPEKLTDDYRNAVNEFFKTYKPTEEDNLKLIEILINPQVYETIRLLRTTIATKDLLQKLRKKGVDDVDAVLMTLWENQVVQVFQGHKGIEYYGLLSDIGVSQVFPKYILNTIIEEYDVKSKANRVLVEFLKVLEDAYYAYKAEKKLQKKEEKTNEEE